MFRNLAFAVTAISLLGSASAAIAAPTLHQTQASESLRQRTAIEMQGSAADRNPGSVPDERPIVHHGNPWGHGSRGD